MHFQFFAFICKKKIIRQIDGCGIKTDYLKTKTGLLNKTHPVVYQTI